MAYISQVASYEELYQKLSLDFSEYDLLCFTNNTQIPRKPSMRTRAKKRYVMHNFIRFKTKNVNKILYLSNKHNTKSLDVNC